MYFACSHVQKWFVFGSSPNQHCPNNYVNLPFIQLWPVGFESLTRLFVSKLWSHFNLIHWIFVMREEGIRFLNRGNSNLLFLENYLYILSKTYFWYKFGPKNQTLCKAKGMAYSNECIFLIHFHWYITRRVRSATVLKSNCTIYYIFLQVYDCYSWYWTSGINPERRSSCGGTLFQIRIGMFTLSEKSGWQLFMFWLPVSYVWFGYVVSCLACAFGQPLNTYTL